MLNINNLNRVRRVLSAQQGAKTPSLYESLYEQERIEQDSFQDFVNKNFKKLLPKAYESYPMYDKTNINMNFISASSRQQLKEAYENQQKIGSLAPKVDTNLNILSKEEETFAKEKLKPWYNTTYGLSKEQRQDIKDRYAWSKENPDKDVADFDHYATPKEMEQKAKETQPVPDKKLAQAASLTPHGTYTTQPTTSIPQNTTIPTPEVASTNTRGDSSEQNTSTEEQSEKSKSFLKGEDAGQKIGAKIGNFLNSDGVKVAGKYGAQAGQIADIVDGAIRSGNDWAPQTGFENTWDQASTIAMKFGPLGQAIGGGMKVAKVVSDLFGSKTQDFAKDISTLETVGGSYGGSSALIEDAANKAGKKYGLFASGAKRRANRLIDRARVQQYAMQGIAEDARDLNSMRSYMDPYYLQYQSDISGGYDQRYMHVAKLGGTLTLNNTFPVKQYVHINKDYTPNFYKSGGILQQDSWFPIINESEFYWDPIITFETPTFKSGGTIKEPEIEVIEVDTTQKSVIPEGALHKNKHNLDQVGVDDSELTKKGIPVVDNQGDQQAEIELNEIIFTLEVTKELEKRYKEYYKEETKQSRKDELAIEAGKLLWKEILYNTDDRTGLIDTLKKGGSIPSKSTIEHDTIYIASPIQEFKPFVLPEFKTFAELKKYLKQTGRDSEEDYNLKAAYEDSEVYKIWREEEQKHPGSGHWLDKYKKPNHPTFSTESIYSNLQTPGGELIESEDGKVYFIPSEYLKSLYSKEFYNEYFKNDPKVTVIYSKKTTQKKKHQFGGVLQQEDVTIMVKQALIDLFSKL